MPSGCLSGFEWDGIPIGKHAMLANNDTYVTGTDKNVAVLIIHDIYGWTFPNTRLVADHFAKEIDATVFIPDLQVFLTHRFRIEARERERYIPKADIPCAT